jgi:hypothetical protein
MDEDAPTPDWALNGLRLTIKLICGELGCSVVLSIKRIPQYFPPAINTSVNK